MGPEDGRPPSLTAEEEEKPPSEAPADATPSEKRPPESTRTALATPNTETAVMKDEEAMDPSDAQRPKSCREKFLHAWNEKLKLQSCPPLSPQVSEGQPAIYIPDQEKRTENEEQPSQFLASPSSVPNEYALHLLMVTPSPPECPPPLSPRGFSALEPFPQQPPLSLSGGTSGWETANEEEFLQICTSDIVLQSPMQKRPRLLPPDRKMYVEVPKREASSLWEEPMRCPAPLEFNHLVDTMVMSTAADLPQMEAFYRSSSPGQRRHPFFQRNTPVHPVVECLPLATDLEAANLSRAQQDHWSLERSPSQPEPMMFTREYMNSSQNRHLPPKKRYTRGWL